MGIRYSFIAFVLCFIWPVLHLINHNFSEFEKSGFQGVTQITVICLGMGLIGALVLICAIRVMPRHRVGLVTLAMLLTLAFFLFSNIHAGLAAGLTWIGMSTGAGVGYILFVLVLIFLGWRFRDSTPFHRVVATFVIVASMTPALGLAYKTTSLLDRREISSAKANSNGHIGSPTAEVPDGASGTFSGENVYYIIVDGYVGDRNLKKVIDLDIKDFVQQMSDLGFYYIEESRSNYVGSATSIASIFHLNYFRDEKSTITNLGTDNYFPIVLNKAAPPPLIKSFMSNDYSLYFSESWYSGCKNAYFECIHKTSVFDLNRESQFVLSRTLLKRLLPNLFFLQVDAIGPIDDTVLRRIIRPSQPFFLFAHHMQPHSPFYFDRKCNAVDASGRTDRELFREAALCVNRTVYDFVERIIDMDPDAIIIIHADHGSGFIANEEYPGIGEYELPLEAIDERSETISLVRAPRVCSQWLRSDLGPINTARFLVGCLARTEPVYLPERLFLPGPDYDETQALIEFEGFHQ